MTHLRVDPIDLPLESPSVDFFELGGGLEGDDDDEFPPTLDPDVLTSLVIQLRTNLASAQRERDELSKGFYTAQGRLKDLQGADERATALAKELAAAKAKHQEDEEAISMLRTKVEESRRGLMRLQTESRRMSGMQQLHSAGPMNLNFADGPPRTPIVATSKANKRSSLYIPSTGGLAGLSSPPSATTNGRPNGHRRISSLSDPGNDAVAGPVTDKGGAQILTMPQDVGAGPPSAAIRRFSLLTTPRQSLLDPQGAEIESLRNELHAVRMELVRAQTELKSAEDAKVASDVMVKALREFIAETPVAPSAHASEDGMSENGYSASTRGISLPPLPTDNIDDEEDQPAEKTGFFSKLWKSNSAAPSPNKTSPPPVAAKIKGHAGSEAGSISSFVASWTKSVPTAEQMSPPLNAQKGNGPRATSPKYAHSIAETTRTYSTAASLSEPNSPEAGSKPSVVVVVNGDEEREIHSIEDKLMDGNRTPTTGDRTYGVRLGSAA